MAKAPPGFTFYPNDFLGGTHHMNAQQVGIYFRLLCHQWANGCIPTTKRRCCSVTGVTMAEWDEAWKVLREKFERIETSRFSDGNLKVFENQETDELPTHVFVNSRMFDDREKAIAAWRKRMEGGKLGGRPKTKTSRLCARKTSTEKGKGIKKGMKEGGVGETEAFEKLWSLYPRREGRIVGKAAAREQFRKIPSEQWPQVLVAVKNYATHCRTAERLPKDPQRFLRDIWTDFAGPPSNGHQAKPTRMDDETRYHLWRAEQVKKARSQGRDEPSEDELREQFNKSLERITP